MDIDSEVYDVGGKQWLYNIVMLIATTWKELQTDHSVKEKGG